MSSRTNPFGQRNYGGSCRCSECDRTFGGLSGFDVHRINTTGRPGYDREYDWRCATDAELEAKLHQDAKGWWIQEARFAPGVGTRTVAEREAEAEPAKAVP